MDNEWVRRVNEVETMADEYWNYSCLPETTKEQAKGFAREQCFNLTESEWRVFDNRIDEV